jgi:ubiquinone/menaquinone biosynthesis C-methylase UbiE
MTSVMERLSEGVCRRAFSSPEALAYETCIAPAVSDAVSHDVDRLLGAGLVLDVGAGGGGLAAVLSDSSRRIAAMDPSASQARRIARRGETLDVMWSLRGAAGALPFRSESFDGVLSCCALKHWPDPVAGLVECARVARVGAPIVLIEVDGGATQADFRVFASSTRVPFGMKRAYTRFAMRTVVGVAPTRAQFERLLGNAGLTVKSLDRIAGTPFITALAMA